MAHPTAAGANNAGGHVLTLRTLPGLVALSAPQDYHNIFTFKKEKFLADEKLLSLNDSLVVAPQASKRFVF